MHPLDGVAARILVAHDQINALEKSFKAFSEDNPHTVAIEKDAQSGKVVAVLRNVAAFPLKFSVDVGLIAHGLRSALDNLACQLAYLDRGYAGDFDKVCEQVQFPIRIYGPRVKPPKGGPVSERAYSRASTNFAPIGRFLAPIEKLQPYQPGNGDRTNALWLVNCLDNTDKHRVLVLLAMSMWQTIGVGSGPSVREPPKFRDIAIPPEIREGLGDNLVTWQSVGFTIKFGEFVNGAVVAEFNTDRPEDVNMKFLISPKAAFGKGCPAVEGRPVLSTLRQILNHVAQIVESFATEFAGSPSHGAPPTL